MYPYIRRKNRRVLKLPGPHPAKTFLSAFIECRFNCVGKELGLGGAPPIDQAWQSAVDGKLWKFSAFAYGYLSFDIVLDGYLKKSSRLTESEHFDEQSIGIQRILMHECAAAAAFDGNREIIKLTEQVLNMLELWERYLEYRKEVVAGRRAP
jgi:hypothetical protein